MIIPARDAGKYLRECLESLFAALPRHMDSEVILVDDGSEDQTGALAASFGCTVLRQEKLGAAAARNRGVGKACGEHVFFLDADDLLCDGALDASLAALREDAALLAVFTQAVDFVSPELSPEAQKRFVPRTQAYSGCLPGCGLFRRAVFARVGLFDETMLSGETVAWLLRLRDSGVKSLSLEKISLRRRLHPDSTGAKHGAMERKDYLTILRKRAAERK